MFADVSPTRPTRPPPSSSYINLLSPEPTDAFIASTHEKYAAAFGGDLSAFDAFFTDEPSLMSLWMRDMPWGVLPYAAELSNAWRGAWPNRPHR